MVVTLESKVRRETPRQTEARMVAKAIEEKIAIYYSRSTGSWWASSSSGDGSRYAVSPISCECLGFQKFGYCKHWAMLRYRLDLAAAADTDDDPPPTSGGAALPANVTMIHRRSAAIEVQAARAADDGDADDDGEEDLGAALSHMATTAADLCGHPDGAAHRQLIEEIRRTALLWARAARVDDSNDLLAYCREFMIGAALAEYRRLIGDEDLELERAA